VARAGAKDSRAAGIPWLFSPILGLGVQPLWSRFYETLGEDPLVVSTMGVEWVNGIQKEGSAACAKHFVGYSDPLTGHDRSPASIPRRWMREYFMEPFRKVVDAGVMTVMESYSEVDGVPMAMNGEYVKTALREEMGFQGVVVTDFEEMGNLVKWHHVAKDMKDAVGLSLKETGIDMSMIPYNVEEFQKSVKNALYEGVISMERINESVARILTLKENLGLLDGGVEGDVEGVGSKSDESNMMTIVKDTIVLAKNNAETLPIKEAFTANILITGPTASSLRYQTGGWTWSWQGDENDGRFSYGKTVARAFVEMNRNAEYACGVDILGHECENDSINEAVSKATGKEYVIVCVGEETYAEKPGDIDDLSLPNGQYELVRRLKETNAKIILVYFGGRPRLLKSMSQNADAIILAFLPGPQGGQALADIITGAHNPSAKLPFTYPRTSTPQLPYYAPVSSKCTLDDGTALPHKKIVPCRPEFPFGWGLSYTQFMYSDLAVSSNTISKGAKVTVSVTVRNVGPMKGSDTVFIFSFDENRRVTPEQKRLRHFATARLDPGESKDLTFNLHIDDLRFVGYEDDRHKVLQHGLKFRLGVGVTTDCRGIDKKNSGLCTDWITVDAGEQYIAECEAACHVWKHTGCGLKEQKCMELCQEEGEKGWGWNYVSCIESVAQGIPNKNHTLLSDRINHLRNSTFKKTVDEIVHSELWHKKVNISISGSLKKLFEPSKPKASCHDMTLLCRNIYATTYKPEILTSVQCVRSALDKRTSLILLGIVYATSLIIAVYLIVVHCCRSCYRCCCKRASLEDEIVLEKDSVELTGLTGVGKGKEENRALS